MLVWSKASDVKTDFAFLKFSCHRSIKLLSACDVCQTWEPSWNLRLCWWNTLFCEFRSVVWTGGRKTGD